MIAVQLARGRVAEIATRLGVTRQSARERWRDLDGEPTPKPGARPGENVLDELMEEAFGLGNGPGSGGVCEPLYLYPHSNGGAVDEQTGESVT